MSAPIPDRRDRPDYVGLSASDWLGGCATLPALCEWVYWQISLYNMDKGEPVPANRLPMILVRYPGGDWQADLDLLIDLGKVHRTASGSLFVRRSIVEYERANAALQKKRNAGKKGAQSRWGNNGLDSSAIGDAIENGCDTNGRREEKSRDDLSLSGQTRAGAQAQAGAGPREGDLLLNIDPDTWAAFAEHRVKLKAPLTERASTMIRNELIRFLDDNGDDPNAVLKQSILRGWKGVFPLKDQEPANGKRSGWRMDHE